MKKVFLLGVLLSVAANAAPHPKGLVIPLGWEHHAKFERVAPKRGVRLPSHFSLADKWGFLPPHRDQGSCGSCWAHATTEAVRLGYFWKTGKDVDLSVQETLSCSGAGSCDGGYFNALDFIKVPGLAVEGDFPYVAADVPCKTGLQPVENAVSWSYIGDQSGPRAEDLKVAILTGVPVPVTIAADDNFQAYTGGVLRGKLCSGRVPNHMVNLIGWDNTKRAWKIRNSWGDSWGDNGDLWAGYHCDLVGGIAVLVKVP